MITLKADRQQENNRNTTNQFKTDHKTAFSLKRRDIREITGAWLMTPQKAVRKILIQWFPGTIFSQKKY